MSGSLYPPNINTVDLGDVSQTSPTNGQVLKFSTSSGKYEPGLDSASDAYKGVYNATTNTPTLVDGTGLNGDYHRVSVGGSQDFGSGSITFDIGDLVLYNGTLTVWEKVDGNPDLVSSVAGRQGDVVVVAADLADFDTEVSNNGDVAANTTHTGGDGSDHADVATNTLKVSADGSVATHSDVTDAGSGAIITTSERNQNAEVYKFAIGSVVETAAITVTESGGTVSLNLEKDGTGDLTLIYSDGLTNFDCTPIQSVALTPGTDPAPTKNVAYILKSTGLLTAGTGDFPSAEHVPIAKVVVQSASGVATDGAYSVHQWNDHLSLTADNGHLSHLNAWIRAQHATWINGVSLTPTVTTNGGALDNLDIATASGNVRQLHPHAFPAFDTAVTSSVFVRNDPTTAFVKYDDLNLIIQDAAGTTLRDNNDRYNLVVWGVVSDGSADSKLYVNLPTGKYTGGGAAQDTNAIADFDKTADFTIPTDFVGVGFLVARLTVKFNTTASGTLAILQNESLRGQLPTIVAGGTVGQETEFSDAVFKVFDNADSSKEIALEASAISASTTRTITMPDADVDLGEVATNTTHAISTGADHSFIDQDVTDASSPTLDGANITNAASAITIVQSVRKGSAGTIAKGNPVYVSGFHVGSGSTEVEEADNDSASTMPGFGLAMAAITNSANTDVILEGKLFDIDTSAWSVGDELYVSGDPSTTLGMTSTKPTGTALIQRIAIVLRSHASNGVVAVYPGRANDLPQLTDDKFWLGNATGVPTEIAMSGDATMDNTGVVTVVPASATVAGIAELATVAETDTGTDDTRAVTPAGLVNIQADVDTNTTHVGDATLHRIINDAGTSTTELWSANKVDSEITASAEGRTFKGGVLTDSDGLGNITLSAEQTLNGELTSTDTVLLVEQTAPAENGPWVTAAGAWARPANFNGAGEAVNGATWVVSGPSSTSKGFQWVLTTEGTITIDTTPLTFVNDKVFEFGTTAGKAAEGNDSRIPAQDENDALVGTDGTPSTSNKYVTNSDSRNTDSRAPTNHASDHTDGTDDIQNATAAQKGLATAAQITKLDAIEAAADVTDNTNVNAAGATMNADTTLAGNGYFLDEDNMASDSATKVSSQQAVKKYVDDEVLSGRKSGISFLIDGGGSAITTGVKGDIEMPFAGTITAARLFADQTGSIVIDIFKDTFANFPPTVADTITASAKPTISSGVKDEDSTLTGWTTAFAAGDILRINVDSITTVERVTLSLTVTKD